MQVRTNLLKELEREFLPAGVAPPPAKKEIPWKRRPSPARSFLILISSIVIGVGLFSFYFYPKGNTTAARFLGLGIPVETVTVQGETFMEIIGAGGKTESAAVMEIRSWVGGKVLLVPVEVGTVVPKDHILAQLDPAPYEAALKLAQAKFTEDKTSFEKSELFEKRMNALFARRLISNIERERATRELNTARVHFSNAAEVFLRAQDNLDHVVIAAQAPGVILERKIEPGDVVNPKEILFLLGSTESVQVVVAVPQEKADRVKLGQEADLVLDAYPNTTLTGEVVQIDPSTGSPSDGETPHAGSVAMRNVNVSIRVKSALKIEIGIPAYVWIKSYRKGLTIPKFSVIQATNGRSTGISPHSGQAAVFVLENSRARMQPIRIGGTRKSKVEVLEGLTEGQEVVARGLSGLQDHDRVKLKGLSK